VKALWLLGCLALAACADLETKPFVRVDGAQGSPEQLDVDKTACRQEMQRSMAATNRAAALDRDVVRTDVYDDCMARLGYSGKNPQRASPPPPAAAPPIAQGNLPPPPPGASTPPTGARPVAQGSLPPRPQGAPPSPAVASTPPSPRPPEPECRNLSDLRMWLPPCN
jgi:hypothetical protein